MNFLLKVSLKYQENLLFEELSLSVRSNSELPGTPLVQFSFLGGGG